MRGFGQNDNEGDATWARHDTSDSEGSGEGNIRGSATLTMELASRLIEILRPGFALHTTAKLTGSASTRHMRIAFTKRHLPDAISFIGLLPVDHAATLRSEGYVDTLKVFDVSRTGIIRERRAAFEQRPLWWGLLLSP